MKFKAVNKYPCKVCNGTGRFKVYDENNLPPITVFDCTNCNGERFLSEDDPRSVVTVPKWV